MAKPTCLQERANCFAYSVDTRGRGICECLNNTKFLKDNGKPYKCPFFKPKGEKDKGQY